MAKEIRWTVPASFFHPGTTMFRAVGWRGEAPAHVPSFFLQMANGVYFDFVATCWGRPVYRQRMTRMECLGVAKKPDGVRPPDVTTPS